MSSGSQQDLLQALQQPACYDHPVEQVELIETHISWVFLAGDFAYKVKKPLNFGFLDFSSLKKRQHFCAEEIRLNRRFAPQLYLGLVAIGGSADNLQVNGQPPLEYAVKMRRFPQSAQLDRLLSAKKLSRQQLEVFASYIARLHQEAPVAPQSQDFGSPASIRAPVEENFSQIRPLLSREDTSQLDDLAHWSQRQLKKQQELFCQRKTAGFVRECHGDLHLANMAWIDAQPVLFDGIEFNQNLRWIDVCSDIAFLIMDLDDRGQENLGWAFLNCYLQQTGDYQGLQLLRFYLVYRAMVRAKVTRLRLSQAGLSDAERKQDRQLFQSYLDLATSYTKTGQSFLIMTHGLSGSGKTTFAGELASNIGAIHVRSDLERKRLHGLEAKAASGSPIDGGIYSSDAFEKTYQRLIDLARQGLEAGIPVIIDACFLQNDQRDLAAQLARTLQAPLLILDFSVPTEELRQRIQQRLATESDASEATLEVLNHQLATQQPLRPQEASLSISVSADTQPDRVAEQITQRIREFR